MTFVDPQRIEELRAPNPSGWDLSRLVALCEELNVAWTNGLWHSVGALTRAILDHVPPIFGCKSFGEVANNYAGSKSFRETMQYLDKAARKVGDGQLHTQVRAREVLPTATQVNFSSPLDVLLGEVVRIQRSGAESTERLKSLVTRATELMDDFLCSDCGSPIKNRDIGVGTVSTELGDYDVDWEDVYYECGRVLHDGKEITECQMRGPRPVV